MGVFFNTRLLIHLGHWLSTLRQLKLGGNQWYLGWITDTQKIST